MDFEEKYQLLWLYIYKEKKEIQTKLAEEAENI